MTYTLAGLATTLVGSIGPDDTLLRFAAGCPLPSTPMSVIQIGTELLLVRSRSGELAAVSRAHNGTVPDAHTDGDAVELMQIVAPPREVLFAGSDQDAAPGFTVDPLTGEVSMDSAYVAGAVTAGSVQAGSARILDVLSGDKLTVTRNAAPLDADLAAGQAILWFDPTDGASALMIKAKQADGSVKTAAIALA